MTRKRALFALAACAFLFSSASAQLTYVDYFDGDGLTPIDLPMLNSGLLLSQVGMYVNPAAGGDLDSFELMLYDDGATSHNGDLVVRVHEHNEADFEPGAAVGSITVDVTGLDFYPDYASIDLTSLAYSFEGEEAFWISWSFLPDTEDDFATALIETGGNLEGSIIGTDTAWLGWFTNYQDMVMRALLDYTETPPGHISLLYPERDLGRIEADQTVSTEFLAINTGGMDAEVTSISLTNPTYFSALAAETLPATVAPGDTLLISLSYDPQSVVAFRDTTTLIVNSLPDGGSSESAYGAVIAGSSDCDYLSNYWVDETELGWHVSQFADTTESWSLYYSNLRDPYFLGHEYTAPGDTAANMLWTTLPNPDEWDIDLTFAQDMDYPDYTQNHALYFGSVEEDEVVWDRYIDLSDSTYLVWGDYWTHLSFLLTELSDTVAVGFYYEGSDADNWYIDDVEFCFSEPEVCDPVELSVTTNQGSSSVVLGWEPTEGMLHIYASVDAYTGFSEVSSVDASLGTAELTWLGAQTFYQAVLDCDPPVETQAARLPEMRSQKLIETNAAAGTRGEMSFQRFDSSKVQLIK